MNYYETNPKSLDLDTVRESHKKVTLGFRCEPELKLTLADEAEKLGLTLSQYVENLITNYDDSIQGDKAEKEKLMLTVNEQKNKIAFYENDMLNKLLKENMGETVEFVNGKSEKVKIKIQDIKDVYTVVINSFQTKKP